MIVEESERRIRGTEFIGGSICLDFANTVHNFGAPDPLDDLLDYESAAIWAYQAGLISASERDALKRTADGPMREIQSLRAAIYRTFSALSSKRMPAAADLEEISKAYRSAMNHISIRRQDGQLRRMWSGETDRAHSFLWPIALSAADLLVSVDVHRVRECSGPTCTWLFLDRSKNGSRRWCDMSACGNRQKSRKHYQRSKPAKG